MFCRCFAKRDRKYVTGFEELPFAGFAKLHWVELDLGEWDAQKPLRLIDGWIHGLFHGDFDVCGGSGGDSR